MIRLATKPRLTAVIALFTVVPLLAPVAAVGAGGGAAATDAAPGTDGDASNTLFVGEIEPGGYTETTIYIGPDDRSWSVSDVYITGEDSGSFSVAGGGGSFALDAGQDREITIGFGADTVGMDNATLVIDEEQGPIELPMAGEVVDSTSDGGGGGDTATSLSFNDVPVGETVTKTVTIPGSDRTDVTLTASVIGTDSDLFQIVDGGGTFTIPEGGEHDITVAFTPDEVGSASARIEFDPENDNFETRYGDLTGEAVEDSGSTDGDVTLSTNALDFPTVPLDRIGANVVVIRNDKSEPVSLTVSATTDGPGSIHLERTRFRVAANSSQPVPIVFVPGAQERTTGTVSVDGPALDEPLTVSVSGEGAPPFEPGRSIAFVTRNVSILSPSVDQSVLFPVFVRNNASETIELSISDLSSPFTVVRGGGTVSLEPGEIHAIFTQYDPTSEGEVTDELVVDRTGTDETLTIGITGKVGDPGEVDPPEISLSAETLDFGTVPVGETVQRTLTVTNTGTEPAQIGGVVDSDGFSVVDGTPIEVDPGESREVVVEFEPDSEGQTSGSFTVIAGNEAGLVDREVRLVGEGTTGDGQDVDVSLSAEELDFGVIPVGETVERTLTVTNDGNGTVTVGAANVSGPFEVVRGDQVPVDPGESREVRVRFAPDEVGQVNEPLTVLIGDGESETERTVALIGTGAAPDIDVSVTDDRLTAEDPTTEMTVANRGEGPLIVDQLTFPGPFSADVDEPLRVPAGEERTFTVTFDASVDTNVTAGVRIESNDAADPVVRQVLRGIPESPNATVAIDGGDTDDGRQVNATVTDVEEGSTVDIDTSTGVNESENVSVDGLSIEADEDEFSLNVTTSDDELDTTPDFNLSDGTEDVGYLRVNHTVPDENISSVSFTFTVPKSEIPVNESTGELDPEEMTMFRYVDEEWVELRTDPVRELDDAWEFQAYSPGLSEFAIGRKEPNFEIDRAEINVTSSEVGDSVAIRVLITNTGGADGIFDVRLLENGELVDREQPTVPPNSTVRIVFLRSYEEAGQYQIGVNNRTVDTVEVESAETETETTTDDETEEPTGTTNPSSEGTTEGPAQAGASDPDGGGGDGGFPVVPLLAAGLLVTAGAGVVYRQFVGGDEVAAPDDDSDARPGTASGEAVDVSDDEDDWSEWEDWDEEDGDGPPPGGGAEGGPDESTDASGEKQEDGATSDDGAAETTDEAGADGSDEAA